MDRYGNGLEHSLKRNREAGEVGSFIVSEGSGSIFKDKRLNGTGKIIALRRYHKYWITKDRQEKNPLVGEFEKTVLDLKEMKGRAIRRFFEEIDPLLGRTDEGGMNLLEEKKRETIGDEDALYWDQGLKWFFTG